MATHMVSALFLCLCVKLSHGMIKNVIPIAVDGWGISRLADASAPSSNSPELPFSNMSYVLGTKRVKRCPFEQLGLIEDALGYDPVQVNNAATEKFFKTGQFQTALTCLNWVIKQLTSDVFQGDLTDTIASVNANINALKLVIQPPQQMITKRIFHSTLAKGEKLGPDSSLPLRKQKDRSIMVWDGAISPIQCQNIIGLFENSTLYEGNLLNNGKVIVDRKHKKVHEFDISGSASSDSRWAAVDSFIVSIVTRHLAKYEEYNRAVKSKNSPLYDGGFQMKRYINDGTEHHAFHIDAGKMPACGPQRVMAVIIYLNEVSEGGETLFWDYGKVVKPRCGRVLMFPTAITHTHAGRPPISNNKYNIVGFIME